MIRLGQKPHRFELPCMTSTHASHAIEFASQIRCAPPSLRTWPSMYMPPAFLTFLTKTRSSFVPATNSPMPCGKSSTRVCHWAPFVLWIQSRSSGDRSSTLLRVMDVISSS